MTMAVVAISRIRRRILRRTLAVPRERPARLARAQVLALALVLTLALAVAWLSCTLV